MSHELVSPHFWARLLAPVHPTKPCREVRYLVPKDKLRSVLAYGGYPLSAEDVVDGVTKIVEA